MLQTIASLRAFSPLLNQEGEKNEGKRLQVGTSRHDARDVKNAEEAENATLLMSLLVRKGVQIGLADTQGERVL